MAERAEAINRPMDEPPNIEEGDRSLAPVIPVRTEPEVAVSRDSTTDVIKQRTMAGLGEAMDRAARSYSVMADKSNLLLLDLTRWARRVREQNPLQVVAVVAGAAFVLGVVLRFWNSKRSA